MSHLLWKMVEVLALFVASFFGPGFFLVRRLAWTGAEKIAAAFGLSVLLIGVTTSAIYLGNLPWQTCWAVTALSAGAIILSWPELVTAWREAETRALVVSIALVTAWMIGCTVLIRSFSGGGWAGDWAEHYDRIRFYLRHWPLDTKFVDVYWLPARPPLMNLVTAHILAMAGPGFPLFQLVSTLLNASIVIPAFLLARRVAGDRGFPTLLVVALVAFNPMMVENTTYPWTKLLATTFVCLGSYFYVTGWERTEVTRLRFAVVFLGAAILTHYSAAPFALFFAAHYAWRGSRAFADRAGELVRNGALACAVVAPWVLWAIKTYGTAITFGANTSAEGYASRPFRDNVAMVVSNIWNTFIPHQLRNVDYSVLGNMELWSRLRDDFFFLYQTNALFMIGSAGVVVLAYTLWKERPSARQPEVRFWVGFSATALLLGLASNGAPDMFGLAHISLHPLALVILAWLAGSWALWPASIRLFLLAGLVFDLICGVFLQLLVEARIFGEEHLEEPGFLQNLISPPSFAAASNWMEKMRRPLPFIGDFFYPARSLLLLALVAFVAAILGLLIRRLQLDVSEDVD